MQPRLSVILLLLNAALQINAHKILGIFPFCNPSHYQIGFRFMNELTNRGHEVTFINCFPQKDPIKNLKDVSVVELQPTLKGALLELESFGQQSYIGQLFWISKMATSYMNEIFQIKAIQDLANSNEKFDVIIMENFVNEAMTIFHHIFKAPLIILAPGPMTLFNNYIVGNPAPPSYVPNIIANYDSKMTFCERAVNTYRFVTGELFIKFVHLPTQQSIMRQYFPDAPEITTLLGNTSMLLLLSHVSLSDPVPLQQNVKSIGGYHVSPPKRLPNDLKQFLDNATDGVILFTMGSALQSSQFKPEKKQAILNAFSKLKQKVIWKFETDLPGKPENVMIKKWLPQQDIMAHPNVIAFISHGGLLGTIEAVYHGLPILGLPVYWDQEKNIAAAARKDFAVKLSFQELNEDNFDEALNEIINNPKYRRAAKERSKIFRDNPQKPLDEAVYWTEYVIRHKGAPFLRSAAVDLKWYQLFSLDVVVVAIVVFVSIILVLRFIVKSLFFKKKPIDKVKLN